MKLSPIRAGMLVLLAGIALGATAETIATVNGKAIPMARLEALERNALMSGGAAGKQQPRAELIKNLVDLELASQEFERLGLAKDALIQNRMEVARQGLMLQELVVDYMTKNIPSEADVQAEFEKRNGIVYRDRHKLHRITVGTKTLAEDAIKRLKDGEQFEELAKQLSIDGDAKAGGDMGWQLQGDMLEALNQVVKTLKPGEITQTPVESPLGYHVVRLDEVGSYKVGPRGKAAQKIARTLIETSLENYLKELRAKAVIE